VANDASATPVAPQPVPNDAPSAESAQPADDDLLGSLFSAEQPVASPHTADQAAAPPPTPEWRAAVISKFNQELGASYESEDQVISEVRQLRDQLGRINTLPGGDAFASAIIDRLKTGTIDDAMHLLHAVKADFLDFDPNAVVTEKVELEDGTESTKELPIGAFRHPLDDVLRAEAYYLYKDRFAENPTDPRFASLVELHIADSKKRLAGIVSPLVRQQEERRLRAAVQETHKAAISDLIKHTSEKANEVYKREQQARERINELVNGLGTPPSELWGQKLRPEVQKKMADSLIDRIKTDPVGYLLELVSVRQPDGSLAVSAEKLMMLEADYNPRHDKEGKGLRNKIIARSAQQMAAELAIKLTAQKVNIDPTKEPDKAPNAENVSNSQPFKVIASKKLS
jgi:hypothetical protein